MPILNQQRFILGALASAAVLGGTLGIFSVLRPPNSGIQGVASDDFTLEYNKSRPLTADRQVRAKSHQGNLASEKNHRGDSPTRASGTVPGQETDLAATTADRARMLDSNSGPKSDDPEIAHAIELIDTGKIEAATVALEQILAKNPQNEQALIELGMIQLIDNHKPEAALPLLKSALQINPNNRMVASEIVGVYEDRGDREEGLAFLKDLYTSHPDADGLAVGIGQILVGQGKEYEAVPYLETAAKSSPDPAFHYAELGDIYGRMGDHDRAAKSYESAINKEYDNLSRASDAGAAAVITERIDNLRKDKASSLIDNGDIEGAEDILRRLGEQNQSDPSVQALWKKIARKRG
jgi:predicted Zn-dependent protease